MSHLTPQIDQLVNHPASNVEKLQSEYLRSMMHRNCSDRSIEYWAMNLTRFNTWCTERGILELEDMNPSVLKNYRQHVYHRRNPNTNKPLKFSTQHCYLIVVRRFFVWLHQNGYTETDIAHNFEIPKPEKRLSTTVFTADDVESILNAIDVTTPMGIRDRAMIETFYSTAIRNTELRNLELYDLDLERRNLIVRQGKGQKDRVVPIGERAISWLKKYLADARPELIKHVEPHSCLFTTEKGRRFSRTACAVLINRYKKLAGVKKPGSCHMLRHTAATLMMDNGADLRSLQEILGHARLATTQLYTHISINRLHEVHDRTHPAAQRPQNKD